MDFPPTYAPINHSARLVRRVHFSCGHQIALSHLSEDENRELFGAHYTPDGYGHNFIFEGYFEGPIDPVTGMVVNLKIVDQWLKEVTDPLDHHFLNTDVPYFKENVPCVENIAVYLHKQLQQKIQSSGLNVTLFKIRLYESDDLWVDHTDRENAVF